MFPLLVTSYLNIWSRCVLHDRVPAKSLSSRPPWHLSLSGLSFEAVSRPPIKLATCREHAWLSLDSDRRGMSTSCPLRHEPGVDARSLTPESKKITSMQRLGIPATRLCALILFDGVKCTVGPARSGYTILPILVELMPVLRMCPSGLSADTICALPTFSSS